MFADDDVERLISHFQLLMSENIRINNISAKTTTTATSTELEKFIEIPLKLMKLTVAMNFDLMMSLV